MYLGNKPADSFTSFAKQDFTTSATTSYTLDYPVANANEIALFINFVRQEPTTAYSASGTTLTLTSATSSSDDMYCVYLGKAVQTVNPPNGSVGTSQLADNAVTTAKITDANITSAKLASGVLPDNTPAFFATQTTAQSIADSVGTILNFGTEAYDTDNALTTTTFTVPAGKGGIYYFYAGFRLDSTAVSTRLNVAILVNATPISSGNFRQENENSAFTSGSANLSAGDTVTVQAYQNTAASRNTKNLDATFFGGYKLIGV